MTKQTREEIENQIREEIENQRDTWKYLCLIMALLFSLLFFATILFLKEQINVLEDKVSTEITKSSFVSRGNRDEREGTSCEKVEKMIKLGVYPEVHIIRNGWSDPYPAYDSQKYYKDLWVEYYYENCEVLE